MLILTGKNESGNAPSYSGSTGGFDPPSPGSTPGGVAKSKFDFF